jgi:hypothetical protein
MYRTSLSAHEDECFRPSTAVDGENMELCLHFPIRVRDVVFSSAYGGLGLDFGGVEI